MIFGWFLIAILLLLGLYFIKFHLENSLNERLRFVINTILFSFLGIALTFAITNLVEKYYDKYTPQIDAEYLIYDIQNDTIYFKYLLINNCGIDVSNIRYISKSGNNVSLSFDKSNNKLINSSKKEIFSFDRLYNDLKDNMSIDLFLFYDIERENKVETFFQSYSFYIPIINTKANSIYPSNTSKPEKVTNVDSIISSIVKISDLFSKDEGTYFSFFEENKLQKGITVFGKGKDKEIYYNSFDNKIYFRRDYYDTIGIYISQQIRNYNQTSFFIASWTNDNMLLIVDNQECITDSIMRVIMKEQPDIAYRDMGAIYFNYGDYERAIMCFNQSLSFNRKNSFITFEKLFNAYRYQNKLTKGIEILEEAINQGHKDSSILINLALAYTEIHEYEKSIKLYKLDNSINQSYSGFLNYLSLMHEISRAEDAKKIFEQAIKIFPNSIDLYDIYILILGDMKKTEEVKKLIIKEEQILLQNK